MKSAGTLKHHLAEFNFYGVIEDPIIIGQALDALEKDKGRMLVHRTIGSFVQENTGNLWELSGANDHVFGISASYAAIWPYLDTIPPPTITYTNEYEMGHENAYETPEAYQETLQDEALELHKQWSEPQDPTPYVLMELEYQENGVCMVREISVWATDDGEGELGHAAGIDRSQQTRDGRPYIADVHVSELPKFLSGIPTMTGWTC